MDKANNKSIYMSRRYYLAPAERALEVRLEDNFVYSPGDMTTNGDSNEKPQFGGEEDF